MSLSSNPIQQPAEKPQPARATLENGQLKVQKGEKEKLFRRDKLILMPEQSADIRASIARDPSTGLFNPQTVTVGPSGYSDVSAFIKSGSLVPGQYEKVCETVLRSFTDKLQVALSARGLNCPIVFTHGASDLGVDQAARNAATTLQLRQFGFNQPEWMFYVPDDTVPVYVAKDKDDYHHKFAAHTMVLLLLGGRNDAAYHDRLNVQQYRNLVLPCPILPFIVGNPPPAWDAEFDRERLTADPVEWAKQVPILDASLAHLRSSPLPEVSAILAGEKKPERIVEIIDLLVPMAVQHLATRFQPAPLSLKEHTLAARPV